LVALVVGLRVWAGLVSPPLAWDGLTYHAYKAARWVQQGYEIAEQAPDDWGYYEFYPHAGEVPSAWAMLATHSDALLAPAGALVWAMCPLGAYSLSRAMGARRILCAYAGLAVGLIPAIVTELATTYIDMYVLGTFLLGCAMMALFASSGAPGKAWLACSGFGLLAGAKPTGLPLAACAFVFLAWLLFGPTSFLGGGGRTFARRTGIFAIALGVLAGSLAGYLRAFLHTGSPFYPFAFEVGGRVILPGNDQHQELFAQAIRNVPPADRTLWAVLRAYLVPFLPDAYQDYLGFGPSGFVISVLGFLGLARLLARPGKRTLSVFLATVAALPFIAFVVKGPLWIHVSARYVACTPAMLAVFATTIERPYSPVVWFFVVALDIVFAFPGGIVSPLVQGMAAATWPMALVAAASVLGVAYGKKYNLSKLVPCVLVVSTAIAGLLLERVRRAYRYPIYAAAAGSNPPFEMHALTPELAGAWPIWERLDDGTPHRIAATFGWDSFSHNAFRYPLLGSRFQNRVLYVPITHDGTVIDYQQTQKVSAAADAEAWIRRLVDERVDIVFAQYPPPPELEWIKARPALFEPIAASEGERQLAFKFRPEGVRQSVMHPKLKGRREP
jgi:hypothetical protein